MDRLTAQSGALNLGDHVWGVHHFSPTRLEVATQVGAEAAEVLDRRAHALPRGPAHRKLRAHFLAVANATGLVQITLNGLLATPVVVQVATQEPVPQSHDPPRGAVRLLAACLGQLGGLK